MKVYPLETHKLLLSRFFVLGHSKPFKVNYSTVVCSGIILRLFTRYGYTA